MSLVNWAKVDWNSNMGLANLGETEDEKRRKEEEGRKRLSQVVDWNNVKFSNRSSVPYIIEPSKVEQEEKRWIQNQDREEYATPKKSFVGQMLSKIKQGFSLLKEMELPESGTLAMLAPALYPGSKVKEYLSDPKKEFKEDIDTLIYIARAFPRAFSATGITLAGQEEHQPKGKFEEILLGKEKIKNVWGRGEDALQWLGVSGKTSKKWALPVGLALTALDLSLVSGGGGKSAIIKEFVGAKSALSVFKVAQKYGMNLKMSELEALAASKTPSEVNGIIGKLLDKPIIPAGAKEEGKGIVKPVQLEVPIKTQPGASESPLIQEAKKVEESTVLKPGHFLPPKQEKQLQGIREIEGSPKTRQVSQEVFDVGSYQEPTTKIVGGQAKTMSTVRKVGVSGEKILRRMGEGGQKLENIMQSQRTQRDILQGRLDYIVKKALDPMSLTNPGGLSKKERINVQKSLQGLSTPKSDKELKAINVLKNYLSKVAKTVEEKGFEVKIPTSEGFTTRPFSARENYYPHIHNLDKLAKGKQREKSLDHLVKTGQARNKAEAEKLLDNYIKANAERRAGNIEFARTIDLPGYEEDPLVALQQYNASVAKRLTETEYFGKRDEKVAEVINQIAEQGGDYKEAQRIFDFTVGGVPESKGVSAVTKFNAITKLSLSFILNSSQIMNTMIKGGVLKTSKNILKEITSAKEQRGWAELAGVYEDFIIAKEAGFKIGKIGKAVLYPFRKVERFLRRVSANVGKEKGQDLVNLYQNTKEGRGLINDLRKNYAVRQLESLGISIEKALTGKLTVDDLLVAANKMSQRTQFKVDPLELPPSWLTPTGRLLSQFRKFNFLQTKFVRDEILKEARYGNIAPMLRFIMLAPIASYLVYKVRNKITGREENDPTKGGLDIRDWDKWLKVAGTIPTEAFSQGQFLYKTMRSDWMTPLQKGARVMGTIGGPTGGEIGNIIAGMEDIPKRKEEGKNRPALLLERQGIEKTPFVGEYLKNKYFGYLPKWEEGTAYEKYQLAKKMSPEEVEARLDQLREDRPSQVESIEKYRKWDELGITNEERGFYYMGVENGDRAKAIFNYLKEMSKEDAEKKIDKLFEAKIISKDVIAQVKLLIDENKK